MDTVLEFKELYRPFDKRSLFICESGSVKAGHVLSIKGPSGSGKSTLLRMLARIVYTTSGDVYWEGKHWMTIPPGTWRRNIHYVSQKPVMFEGTVKANLLQPFSLREIKEHAFFSDSMLIQYMNELDLPRELLEQNAQSLSGGEASRVALIRALLVEPAVLLLDEPTAYLDGDKRLKLIGLIARWVKERSGRAVVMVSHNEDELENINKVATLIMGKGRKMQDE